VTIASRGALGEIQNWKKGGEELLAESAVYSWGADDLEENSVITDHEEQEVMKRRGGEIKLRLTHDTVLGSCISETRDWKGGTDSCRER